MIEVTATVECDLGDTLGKRALCDSLADEGGSLLAGLAFAVDGESLIIGRSSDEGYALQVVDYLCQPYRSHACEYGSGSFFFFRF